MKILISGNRGFIGSSLEAYYRKIGWDVFGWDVDGITSNGNFWYQADMMNPDDVLTSIEKIMPELILHCAGSADVGKSFQYPVSDLQKNYITTENLLFAIKKSKLEKCRFVLFSSAAVYGNPSSLPINETQSINPLSPYALHKRAAEEVCEFVHANYLIDIKVLRIFSVYGSGLKKQIFWDMYQKIKKTGKLQLFGSGEESRDYIHVKDLVAAVSLIASAASFEDIYFNIANGEECTIKEAAAVFAAHAGLSESSISFTGTRREGDPINWRADISRLKKLGYTKSVSFSQGIRDYIEWAESTS